MSFAKNGNLRFTLNILMPLLALIIVGFIIVFIKNYWSEDLLLCDSKNKEVRFSPLETSSDGRRSSYKLCSGDIEGEIVLTAESSADVAEVIVNSLISGLKSTFADSRAPYGGQITSIIGCSNRKYVKEHTLVFDDRNTKIVLAVANDRQIFGICAEDQIKYVSALWAAYDSSKKRLVVVRLYKPILLVKDIDVSQVEILRIFEKTIEHVNNN